MTTKTELVKRYLENHGCITQMDAYMFCNNATRLSSIIYNLKSQGWWIDTQMMDGERGTRYAKYVLIRKADEKI